MKLITCWQTAEVSLVDAPQPRLEPGDLLLRMRLCGICGTDLMKVYDPAVAKPVQLGHEVVGVVEQGNDRFQKGQRVAVAHHAPDYQSHFSRRGSETQDPLFKSSNIDPGGFAELIRVPKFLAQHTVQAIPAAMSDERAVFMEPLACCVRALERCPVETGDTIVVVGVGAIGLLFVPLVRSLGAHVVAVDARQERVEVALNWQAAKGFLADDDRIVPEVTSLSGGRGADLVILTVVNEASLALALACVRDGGKIIPFGVKPGTRLSVDLWQIYRREISLVSSYSATPAGLHRALSLLERPDFALEKTVSHRFPLSQTAKAFSLLHQGQTAKVLIEG